jgi:hypothetical protein
MRFKQTPIRSTNCLGVSLLTGLAALARLALPAAAPADDGRTQGLPTSTARTRTVGDIKPRPLAQAEWRIPGFNRTARIHQADTSDPAAKRLFFLAPPLALVENAAPIPGYPTVVHGVSGTPEGGAVTLDFRALLFLDELLPLARAEIAAQFADGLRQVAVRPEEVEVRRWPVTHAVIDCKLGRRVLATGQTDSLVSVDDAIEFSLDFTPEALADFLAGAQAGKVTFVFAYTYENRRVAEGRLTQAASEEVRRAVDDALRNTLTEAQRNGTQPILLKQVHDLKQVCRLEAARSVRATSKEVLPLLTEQNSPVARFFELKEVVKWDDLDGNDPVRAEVAKYLAPLVAALSTSASQNAAESPESEAKSETATKPKGAFDFKIPVVDLGVSAGIEHAATKTVRDLLKREYGINTKLGKDGKYFVPVDVQLYRFTGGSPRAEAAESQVAYLGVGPSASYFEDSPVPIAFTAGRLRALACGATARPPGQAPEDRRAAAERALRHAQSSLRRARQSLADAAWVSQGADADYRTALKILAAREEARRSAQEALDAAGGQWQAEEARIKSPGWPFLGPTKKQAE